VHRKIGQKGHEVKRAAGVAARWLAPVLGYATSPSPPLPRSRSRRHTNPNTEWRCRPRGWTAACSLTWGWAGRVHGGSFGGSSRVVAGGGEIRRQPPLRSINRRNNDEWHLGHQHGTSRESKRERAHMLWSRDTHMRGLLQRRSLAGGQLGSCCALQIARPLLSAAARRAQSN
jgi:hypothetical protein